MKQVEPGAKAGDTRGDTTREHDNSARTAEARDITALRREMERRDLPAGPPPSFEVSQLEIAADIQQVIARVEAARSQAREADALKLEAETEERLAQAEVNRLSEAEAADAGPKATSGEPAGGRDPSAAPGPGAALASGAAARPGAAAGMLDAHI